MNRRGFLRSVVGIGGVIAAWRPIKTMAQSSGAVAGKLPSDRIPLAGGKVVASRMAIGTGTNGWGGSSNQTRGLGLDGMADLLEAAFEQGITFWDGADQYGSHPHLKAGLQRVPREKVTILTKSRATTAKEMERDIDRFRKEIGTDYLDVLLLHCVTDRNWTERMRGAMDAVRTAQEQGVVKIRGVSCHSLEALKAAAQSDWVELDLARINPAGDSMDAAPAKVVPVLEEMKRNGKTVMGMKVFGAGALRNRREECLRYVLGLESVDCFTIGFESLGEFQDVAGAIKRIAGA